MKENKNQMIYSAEDIAKYFAGKLSPQDMHAMEKAALDDAFLADAMEGYELMKEYDLQNTLLNLKEKINNKKDTGKIVNLYPRKITWYRVAAAILLIGGIGTITYQAIKKNKNTTLPETIAKVEPTNPQLSPNDVNNKPNVLQNKNTATNPNIGITDTATSRPTLPPSVINDIAINKVEKPKESKITIPHNNIPKNEPDSNEDIAMEETPLGSLNTPDNISSGNAFGKKQPQSFVAQVVDLNNNPLPFANINVKNSNTEAYTDAQGNIKLVTDDTILKVNVKSAGYLSQTYTLKSTLGKNKIVLDKDISDAQQSNRKITIIKDTEANAEPIDGWDNYNIYIENNIDIPKRVLRRNIQGDVVVSFDVQSNGKAANTRVDQSLCTPCDSEAKKLIENGPLWRIKKDQSNRASIKVRF